MHEQTQMLRDDQREALRQRLTRAVLALGVPLAAPGVPLLGSVTKWDRVEAVPDAELEQTARDIETEVRIMKTFDPEKYDSIASVDGKENLYRLAMDMVRQQLFWEGRDGRAGITSAEYGRRLKRSILAIKGAVPPPEDGKKPKKSPAKKTKRKAPEFQPPSLDDVQEYIDQSGIVMNAAAFWEHYENSGWMLDSTGQQMKLWKNAARSWAKAREEDAACGHVDGTVQYFPEKGAITG